MAKATHLPKYSRISPIKYTKQLGLLPLFLCAGWRRSSTAGQFCVLANSASSMLQHVSNELKASLIQTIKSCFYASGKKLQRLQRNILASKKRIWNRNLKPETAIAVCLFLEKYEPFIWNPRFSCPDRSPQHLHLKHLCFTPKARTWLWEPFGVVETSPLRNRKFMEKPKAPKSDVHQSFLHMFNS